MDVLERIKIDTTTITVTGDCIKQAKHYLKKRKPDIADQYTTLAEKIQKAQTVKEVKMYELILRSLDIINEIIENK